MFGRLIPYVRDIKDKLIDIKKSTDIKGILYLYRYISWFFTCLFYLFVQPNAPMVFKIGVIITLFGAAKIITDIYIRFSKSFKTLEIAILMESVGITLLLIPTGGLNSPFIWYALNPVLVAASFLPIYFCWINLLFYLVSASVISFVFFKDFMTIPELVQGNTYFILVFVLITFIVQMLSRLTKHLNRQKMRLREQGQELEFMNNSLKDSNAMYKESIDHIMALYQIVETFQLGDNMRGLCSTFAQYASKLTKSETAFVWIGHAYGDGGRIWVYKDAVTDIEARMADYLKNQCQAVQDSDKPIEIGLDGTKFLAVNVKSTSRSYGMMGIKASAKSESDRLYLKQLSFLSELMGVVLESQHLKELEDQLLIIGEQNRIANEIHDSVSQRLFSIVCGIAAITKKWDSDNWEILKHFELIRESANLAMGELRSSIYGLSSRKKGERPFIQMLEDYLNNFKKLHSISISTSITGDEELISGQLKRTLYRIICEGTGNAVNHGQCKHINVTLNMEPPNITLSIEDDGKGFDVDKIQSNDSSGLGMRNMRNLVLTFSGEISIDSEKGKMTRVTVNIPVGGGDMNIMEESAI